MGSSKKTALERIKELQEKGEVLPASNDYIYKRIMTKCFLFKADMTCRITGIPKDLIINTYYEKNSEYIISNALEKGKRSDILFGIDGYIINYELNNVYRLATIIRNDNYLDKIKIDISNKIYIYATMPKAIQINLNNFNNLNKTKEIAVFKSRDEEGIIEKVKWEKYHISFKKVYKKYKKGLELTKLEKELLILRLRKIDEIEELAKGDVELMEVANELKRLSLDINTIGLYDAAEDFEKMINSVKEEGIEKGASNEKKSIAKNLLKDGLPISKICEYTGLSKKQIANLT